MLPLIAVFMLVVIGFSGLVIDVGNVYRVQQALQASTDAAAAAGAGQLTLAVPAEYRQRDRPSQELLSATAGATRSPAFPQPASRLQSTPVAWDQTRISRATTPTP